METFEGIYENGVVRLLEPVPWANGTMVTVIVESSQERAQGSNSPELYRLLGLRFNSGQHDIAARHNEHQP